MIHSMTAFSSRTGEHGPASWVWDLRSVNGRGLDLRLRLPDTVPGLEADLRKQLAASLLRGNVTLGLKLSRDSDEKELSLDEAALDRVLETLDAVQSRAMDKGITLAQPTPADVLSQKGVLSYEAPDTDQSCALRDAIMADFKTLLTDFLSMRAAEGQALHGVLSDQVSQIATLLEQARLVAEKRGGQARMTLKKALDQLLAEAPPVAEDRLAQELALIATKSDITEELDRLRAHIDAARALLSQTGAVGRKLDFLTQEFNREANTLCSKSQDSELTRIGLDLKAVIDQMREQTQNVE